MHFRISIKWKINWYLQQFNNTVHNVSSKFPETFKKDNKTFALYRVMTLYLVVLSVVQPVFCG